LKTQDYKGLELREDDSTVELTPEGEAISLKPIVQQDTVVSGLIGLEL
jgi:hypothetical protein